MNPSAPKHARRWPKLDFLVPLLVALYVVKTTAGILGTFDIGMDDETIYLDGARWLGVHFLPLAESSPLYPRWYRFLTVFEPDPVRLYFLNWFVLATALPLLLYALARRSGAPLWAASIAAIAWASSDSLMTWPYVSMFAALLLGTGAWLATFARDARIAGAVLSVTLTATMFVRAELALPAVAFTVVYVAWAAAYAAKKARPFRERGGALFGVALATSAPFMWRMAFGRTADLFGHGREFFAFGQHYALNVVTSRQLPLDPWTHWYPIAREAFPKAESIVEAARENPGAFFWHVGRNVIELAPNVVGLLEPMPHLSRSFRWPLSLALVAVIAGGVLRAIRSRDGLSRLGRWLPILVPVGAATAASTLLVYPRAHYLLPMCILSLAAVASCNGPFEAHLHAASPRWARARKAFLPLALALVVIAVPTRHPEGAPSFLALADSAPRTFNRENVATVRRLRELAPEGHAVILESDHSRGVYALRDYHRVPQWEKSSSFRTFLHERAVNIVVLNDRLRRDSRFDHDPEFIAFADGTGLREDFEFIPVEGTSVTLAIRRPMIGARR